MSRALGPGVVWVVRVVAWILATYGLLLAVVGISLAWHDDDRSVNPAAPLVAGAGLVGVGVYVEVRARRALRRRREHPQGHAFEVITTQSGQP